jgi:hypothetical protein
VNRTPDPDTISDSVLVIRALGLETGGGHLFRLTWDRDGEPASRTAVTPADVHRLVDEWLRGITSR